MTPEQIEIVQNSFKSVEPIADTAARLFYDRLFVLDPALRQLFTGDMDAQRRSLMQMLTVVVRGLDRLDTLAPAIRSLGQRHAGYGVQPAHFETVGAALLWTLSQGLGSAFTPEVREAWAAAYGVLAATMQAGLAQSPVRIESRDVGELAA